MDNRKKWRGVLWRALFIAACAAGVCVLMLLLTGKDVGAAFGKLLNGAFGNANNFARTLRTMTPLMFTAATFSIALRGNMFNAGGEGQFYVGAFGATAFALTFPELPGPVLFLGCIAASLVCGAVWAVIPGLLKVRFNCSEVVTTLMFNYIAIFFTEYLVRVPFYVPGAVGESGSTLNIPEQVHLTTLIRGSEFTTAFLFGLALLLLVHFWNSRTVVGYEVEIVGSNPVLASYKGIRVVSRQVLVMALSGAVAGLGGALEVLGVFHRFIIRFSPGVGFDGIVVSLLCGNNPLLIPLSAFFMGALKSGSKTMEMFGGVPRTLVDILMGVIIVVVTIKKYPSAAGLFRRKKTERVGA